MTIVEKPNWGMPVGELLAKSLKINVKMLKGVVLKGIYLLKVSIKECR